MREAVEFPPIKTFGPKSVVLAGIGPPGKFFQGAGIFIVGKVGGGVKVRRYNGEHIGLL